MLKYGGFSKVYFIFKISFCDEKSCFEIINALFRATMFVEKKCVMFSYFPKKKNDTFDSYHFVMHHKNDEKKSFYFSGCVKYMQGFMK